MEVKGAAEAFARLNLAVASRSRPASSFSRTYVAAPISRRPRSHTTVQKRYITSTSSWQYPPPAAAEARRADPEEQEFPSADRPSPSPFGLLSSSNKGVASIVDDAVTGSQFRTPREAPRQPQDSRGSWQRQQTEPASNLKRQRSTTSADLLDSEFRQWGAQRAQQGSPGLSRGPAVSQQPMAPAGGEPNDKSDFSVENFLQTIRSHNLSIPDRPEKKFPYKLDPSLGRSVLVSQGMDIQRAIGVLKSINLRNNVRLDSVKQRFHERPGLKRKRLKSERWRAQFKTGFQSIIKRVLDLHRQGW